MRSLFTVVANLSDEKRRAFLTPFSLSGTVEAHFFTGLPSNSRDRSPSCTICVLKFKPGTLALKRQSVFLEFFSRCDFPPPPSASWSSAFPNRSDGRKG